DGSRPAGNSFLRCARQRQLTSGRIARQGGTRTEGCALAYRDRRYQLRIRADKGVVFDDGLVLVGAIVVASDGACADVDALTHHSVPDIRQVTGLGLAP